jgi:hypothetical protein
MVVDGGSVTAAGTYSIDISSVTGSYYVGVIFGNFGVNNVQYATLTGVVLS